MMIRFALLQAFALFLAFMIGAYASCLWVCG